MHIVMDKINKSFGNNQVLFDAHIDIEPGEVHAFVGENGAGKSTMMNILTGVHQKDSGSIQINGQEVAFSNPKMAEEAGISFIHQELNVLDTMTIEENLFLNKEIKRGFGLVDKPAMEEETRRLLDRLDLDLSPNTIMADLSVGEQQMIEIAKALMAETEVIIMDEPTSALTDKETQALFKVIENLTADGVSVVYISHRMEEIFTLSNRITIQRDGHYVDTLKTSETNENEVISLMIGRELTQRFPVLDPPGDKVVLEVEDLAVEEYGVQGVSFDLRQGEILAFSGLMGSGRSQVMHGIFGSQPLVAGKIRIDGQEVQIKNPKVAMDRGIGFVTENRKTEGLLLDKSIRENIILPNLDEYSKGGIVDKEAEIKAAEVSIDQFNIRTESMETVAKNLSGGNQQKVVIAKWILTQPKILILDEPTRGVDVGAKEEIYQLMKRLTSHGISILMVSSDLPEVIGLSHRVAVMHEGRLMGILEGEDKTEENIMTLMVGGDLK